MVVSLNREGVLSNEYYQERINGLLIHNLYLYHNLRYIFKLLMI